MMNTTVVGNSQVQEHAVPVARGYPLVGALPRILQNPALALMEMARENPGAVVAVPLGPMRVYLVTHAPHMQHVLHTHWKRYSKGSRIWKPIERMVGQGLVTSDGQTWRSSRRTIQPVFDHKHLGSLTEGMIATLGRSLEEVADRARGGQPVELFQEMNILTQTVLLESIFDVTIDREEALRLSNLATAAAEEMGFRMFLSFLPDGFPLPGDRRLRQSIEGLDEGLVRLSERWAARAHPERTSMLALLRNARDPETGEGLGPQQMRDELMTMWAAGTETTATLLTWLFGMLDRYPEVEARMRAEVAEVLGTRTPEAKDLERLGYCKRVLMETMRLYPPVWMMPRRCVEDDVVGEDYAIPAGAQVMVSPFVTHRSPLLWDDPDTFDPDRFLPERSTRRPQYAFVPFGGGPRRCVGFHFALTEAQLALVMMLQRFRMQRLDSRPLMMDAGATLRPKGKVMMALSPA